MSIFDQLSSAQGRRDEEPNIALAEELARTGDPASVALFVEQLHGKSRAVAHDCIKVLYELGARRPDLIRPYVEAFVKIIQGGDNRLIWGGMTALGEIATLDAAAIAPHTQAILRATEGGSVITQDWGIRVLAAISALGGPNEAAVMPFLLHFLVTCRPKDLARHAESIEVAATMTNSKAILDVLRSRLPSLKEAAAVRVMKVHQRIEEL